jgi:hypothetical protein
VSIRRAWPSAVVATLTEARLPVTSMPRITIAGRLTSSAAEVSCLAPGGRREQLVAHAGVVPARDCALQPVHRRGYLLRHPRHRLRLAVPPDLASHRGEERRDGHNGDMEGSAQESLGTQSSWLRCYRCWSQNLEVQLHYEGILKVDADTGEAVDPVEEVQEAVVQCLDCLHDQPHLSLTFYDEDGRRISRIEPVEDRWERMVTGTPWVASCTVSVDADQVESCSGPDAAESLAFAAFGDHGTREFFTHVRFHKHEEDRIVIHMLVELYARSSDEATDVMTDAARGDLTITSLAEESRPPASSPGEAH